MVQDKNEDWCDFPNRKDGTDRMKNCPLPNLTKEQIIIAEKRLEELNLKKKILNKFRYGKTKLIRKRNLGRMYKIVNR
jgi:hypothetical protein